jgi:hypothetical protein
MLLDLGSLGGANFRAVDQRGNLAVHRRPLTHGPKKPPEVPP